MATTATKITKSTGMATPKPKASSLVRPTPSKSATVKKPPTKEEIVKQLKAAESRVQAAESRVQELHTHVRNMEAEANQRGELYREACKARDDLQAQVDKLKAEIAEWQAVNKSLKESDVALRNAEKLVRENLEDARNEQRSLVRQNSQLRADLETTQARMQAACASGNYSMDRLNKIPAFIRRIFGAL